jgi:hypothetical protein
MTTTRSAISSLSRLAVVFAFGLLVLGCDRGKPRGTVKGTVTVEGKPAVGLIVFENAAEGIELQEAMEEGAFEAKTLQGLGLPVGTYKVAVRPGRMMRPGEEMPLAMKKGPPAASGPLIPEKYRSTATSGLTLEVKEGANPPLRFDLK